jgi:hypothetical protein
MASDSPGDPDVADSLEERPEDAPAVEHHYVPAPIDFSYRIVVRTVLWVIAGVVFVGFAIWWVLT